MAAKPLPLTTDQLIDVFQYMWTHTASGFDMLPAGAALHLCETYGLTMGQVDHLERRLMVFMASFTLDPDAAVVTA